jgi:hypothetical protein
LARFSLAYLRSRASLPSRRGPAITGRQRAGRFAGPPATRGRGSRRLSGSSAGVATRCGASDSTPPARRSYLTVLYYCTIVPIQCEDSNAPACGCPQPDPDPLAADGAAEARHRGQRRPAGAGVAEHPGAGGLPRHQSEHGGARDRGSEAERARGGAAGQGGCLWPPRSAPASSRLAARPF